MHKREIILPYRGGDESADAQRFWEGVQTVEIRHLPYFLGRPGIFEDDEHEHLKDNFFFVVASGRVILLQAESSILPTEIMAEVQALFQELFGG
jgi:hypothetical protein